MYHVPDTPFAAAQLRNEQRRQKPLPSCILSSSWGAGGRSLSIQTYTMLGGDEYYGEKKNVMENGEGLLFSIEWSGKV